MQNSAIPFAKWRQDFYIYLKSRVKGAELFWLIKTMSASWWILKLKKEMLFFADVARVSKAVHKVFNPDKVNYGAYGDTGCHLHMHIVPKYNGGDEWGSTFAMNPDKVYLTDKEYEEMAAAIRAAL